MSVMLLNDEDATTFTKMYEALSNNVRILSIDFLVPKQITENAIINLSSKISNSKRQIKVLEVRFG